MTECGSDDADDGADWSADGLVDSSSGDYDCVG